MFCQFRNCVAISWPLDDEKPGKIAGGLLLTGRLKGFSVSVWILSPKSMHFQQPSGHWNAGALLRKATIPSLIFVSEVNLWCFLYLLAMELRRTCFESERFKTPAAYRDLFADQKIIECAACYCYIRIRISCHKPHMPYTFIPRKKDQYLTVDSN